ncbi:MAG: hypothetical protein WCF95_03240 [bacterium]
MIKQKIFISALLILLLICSNAYALDDKVPVDKTKSSHIEEIFLEDPSREFTPKEYERTLEFKKNTTAVPAENIVPVLDLNGCQSS